MSVGVCALEKIKAWLFPIHLPEEIFNFLIH